MANVIKSFPDKYINKLATILIMDDEINKMLYYNDVCDEDIYKKPKVKNPIGTLLDKKVFCNRKVAEVFLESDCSIFINLKKDAPYKNDGKESRFFDTMILEIGIICHNKCRRTLNGARESVIFDRVQKIIRTNEQLECVGEPRIKETDQSYNIPMEYPAYIVSVKLNYFNNW